MTDTRAVEFKVDQHPGELIGNFEELNAWMDAQLDKYRGLVFTDDQMADAKKTRAALNRVAKELNDRKLSVKNEFCAPYFVFEDQVKQLIGKVKEVNEGIDSQIRAYENARKEEKRKRIEAWWAENGKRTVPIEKIFDERWLNTTCSDSKWQDELDTIKVRITNQIYTISMMSEDVGKEKLELMLTEYMKRLSIDDAVKAWKGHVEAVKRAEQEKERLEQERLREEGKRAETAAKPEPQPVPETNEEHEPGPDDYLYSPTFKMIDLTFKQAMDLTNYMRSNGLRFESIAKEKRRK